ncbi:MAG: 4-hydroxy-3-methylbut-2-enyl diphosphate reductase 2 [Elusimicrobia bacterium]|nr:4-hydroxy-3-methylbut-2-enyl diphosphate reductase 2 [Elusimicrobiota bacterium]
MKILLVSPRGFCAGVRRAIEIVDMALKKYPPPIYVRKEIVHNKAVVEDFKKRGVVFIDEVNEAPAGSCVIYSAHGIAPEVREKSQQLQLQTIDATCPLVTKVHLEVHRFLREGYTLLLIGHKDHDEVVGTMGEAPGKIQLVETTHDISSLKIPDPNKVMVLTQTTLSIDETKGILSAIRSQYPNASTPPKDDICYATQNRQDAVRELLQHGIDLLLVVGSKNSSNSQRLCDVARDAGVASHLIDQANEINPAWLLGIQKIGLTAGASAPEYLVQEVVRTLAKSHQATVEEVFVREENVVFSLPKELLQPLAPTAQ